MWFQTKAAFTERTQLYIHFDHKKVLYCLTKCVRLWSLIALVCLCSIKVKKKKRERKMFLCGCCAHSSAGLFLTLQAFVAFPWLQEGDVRLASAGGASSGFLSPAAGFPELLVPPSWVVKFCNTSGPLSSTDLILRMEFATAFVPLL